MKPNNPKGLVWEHFDDCHDGEHVFCLLCAAESKEVKYKLPDGQTTNLRGHIRTKHQPEWADMVKEEADKAKAAPPAKKTKLISQPRITDAVKAVTKVETNGAIQTKYDNALIELLACKLLPFNLVDSEEFKNFITILNKTINLKHSTTYAKQLVKYSDDVLGQIKQLIKENCEVSLALTTDIWTSRVMDSYICITIHFIDKQYRLHRYGMLWYGIVWYGMVWCGMVWYGMVVCVSFICYPGGPRGSSSLTWSTRGTRSRRCWRRW